MSTRTPPRHRGRLKRGPILAVVGTAAFGLAVPALAGAAAVAAEPAEPDTMPPLLNTTSFTTAPSGWHLGDPNFGAYAVDRGDSGVASISYSIDGAAVVTEATDKVRLDLSADGVHEIEIWTVDNAGNESFHQRPTVKVDTVAPTITVPPGTPTFLVGQEVAFEYSCDDATSGVASCESEVANGERLDTTSTGLYTVRLGAVDAAGHETRAKYAYWVEETDATAPTVELQVAPEPASGWYASYLGIGIAAADPSGITSLHWSTDGAVSTNGDVVGEDNGGFDLAFDGVTEISYWAFDGAGNRSETRTSTVRIDTIAPSIDVDSPALPNPLAPSQTAVSEFEVEQGEVVPLDFECDDRHSGIASCTVSGLPAAAAMDALPTGELGEQRVILRAEDVAGNASTRDIVYTVVEASDEPTGEPGGNGGSGAQGGAAGAPGASGGNAADGRGTALAETGFEVLPGIVLVGGLLAAGAFLLASRPVQGRRR